MAITFRTSLGAALTHAQMDENFSSVYFSSSIHNIPNSTSKELKLWFDNDTDPLTYHSVELPAPGGGTVTIDGNQNNNVLTATGGTSLQGESNLTFDGSILTLAGRFEPVDTVGNLSIGAGAGLAATAGSNILIGALAGQDIGGTDNVAIGDSSLLSADPVSSTVAVGDYSLVNLTTGHSNTAIGVQTGENVQAGMGNIYIGYAAGPLTNTPTQNNKLYINNSPDDTPLILGDFATGQVTFHSQVSASVFSGSFIGNGAGLTGVTTEWDGTRNGFAQITGSLIVSGSTPTTVQFLNMTAISGSVFSGSFVGDGSGLTGIIANSEWDGTRNGNGEITGSFIVSGSSPTINLKGVTTIDENIKIHNPDGSSIGIGTGTLNNTSAASVALGAYAGAGADNSTTSIGYSAGQNAGGESSYLGYLAGGGNNGKYSTGIGSLVLTKANESSFETALGYLSLFKVNQGYGDVSIGAETLSNLEEGAYNTVVGTGAFKNLIRGRGNVALGFEAGSPKLEKGGYDNVYLGPYTGRDDVVYEENQLYIDNRRTNDALIRGDFSDRILTFNALQIFLPGLLNESDQSPGNLAAINALPSGALYKSWDLVVVKP
jgi:hypothetical protein